MIYSITVTNHLNETLKVDLRNPEKSGFLFYNISGLGPATASINFGDIANSDVSIYNSAKLNVRQINIPIIFSFVNDLGESIEDLRRKTYKFFPVKKPVELVIETDKRICKTTGYVESNDPNIFSGMENTMISIQCPDPFFYDASANSKQITSFTSSESLFEFPFMNDSLSQKLIEFSNTIDNTYAVLEYKGDAEVGVTIRVLLNNGFENLGNIRIFNNTTSQTMIIDPLKIKSIVGQEIQNGILEVSTVKGSKHATFIQEDGTLINVLNSVSRSSDWINVVQGNNVFYYNHGDQEETGDMVIEIENDIVYEGV